MLYRQFGDQPGDDRDSLTPEPRSGDMFSPSSRARDLRQVPR